MEWFSIFVPIIVMGYALKFKARSISKLEVIVLTILSPLLILIIALIAKSGRTSTGELWGSYVTEVRFYEEWDKWIIRTCKTCISRDKNGNCTSYSYYDCSYRRHYDEYWWMQDHIGQSFEISQWYYNQIVQEFGGHKKFVNMNRNYYRIDGDMYSTSWRGDWDSMWPIVTDHTYENRIKVSSSVFNLEPLSQEELDIYPLYDYPKTKNFDIPSILGGENLPTYAEGHEHFKKLNAVLGSELKIRLWVLIYNENNRTIAHKQRQHWGGGDLNEFVIPIGIDSSSSEVTWCEPFSWTDESRSLIEIRNYTQRMGRLDLVALADFVHRIVKKYYIKKSAEDFEYLPVALTTGQIIFVWVMMCIASGIWYYISTNNDSRYNEQYYR